MSTTATTQPVAVPASTRPSRRRLYSIIGGVVLLLVLVGLAVVKDRQSEKPISITVEKAFVKTITHLVTATGKVQPVTEVKISPEVAGELIDLPFKEGQLVKKGDVVVRIKPDFYQAQVEQQEAALASAKASAVLSQAHLTKAEQDFKQSQELYSKKLVSDADYTAAKTNYDVAKADFESSVAQIRRTEGALSQFRDQLNKTVIYAPMDGALSSRTSEVGERVVGTNQFAGTEIMRIADLDNMEVRVKVNENDIINVKLGDHVAVTVDAFPGRKFSGAVREIASSALSSLSAGSSNQAAQAASASDEVTNFLVKISITDPDSKLRPGMSATVDIETQTVPNVIAVPVQSVTVRAAGGKTTEELQAQKAKEAKERSGNDLDVVREKQDAKRGSEQLDQVVFVKKGDKVEMRKVETGITDNSHIEIKSGVKAGEEVVSGSYAAISRKLKDGSKVLIEPVKKDEAK
jgi:HlyD family secretion protein